MREPDEKAVRYAAGAIMVTIWENTKKRHKKTLIAGMVTRVFNCHTATL